MDLGLKGKVAFVAAASKGLGRAVAEELATEGTSLVLCARNAENLNLVAKQIAETSGVPVLPVTADVSNVEDVARAIQSGIEKFGRIDILVTNAGGPPAGRFEDLSPEVWEVTTRLTFNSVLELTRAVLPGMKEREWGRILNITSISVKQPVENLMLSNSLRAAVTGFARTLANEVATNGITVNNI
ncbi:MAG: SDR family NAD(P)-dependent oxidoreductase, partial [Acidobacteria bacterium]|nr:SDR family NAD(P)-dependent oxidoreductase [Acidobacteriota bacterium]MCA1639596.1 SDR family NAD(P)-dependent oxidoreductase [Acidobacteriota bacterium]